MTHPDIVAWRARDSGHRYLQVTANHKRAPVRGRVTAVLPCEQHAEFWRALNLDELEPGGREHLALTALSTAWAAMPITPADLGIDDAAAAVIHATGPDEPAEEVDGT
jgi:hypothetical protein